MTREEEFQRFLNFSVKQKYNSDERVVGWDSWLAAKHDAKPVVELHVCGFSDGSKTFSILTLQGSLLGQFIYEDEYKAFIEANGYRLE